MHTDNTEQHEQQHDRFAAIRPYLDHEFRPVLQRLVGNREFLDTMAAFLAPGFARWVPGLARAVIARKLRRQLAGVDGVVGMQRLIAPLMEQSIRRATWGLSEQGLQNLQRGNAHVFVSNHRDIVMDPAFINLLLHRARLSTVQIGVGDNLLKKPFVADLMRLNKSFIVHRSLRGRDRLLASKLLSQYIHHCVACGDNVWLAPR